MMNDILTCKRRHEQVCRKKDFCNLIEGCKKKKKKMITLTKLLTQVKELNFPRRNVMSREDLQKSIKDTITKYKEIIFGLHTLDS